VSWFNQHGDLGALTHVGGHDVGKLSAKAGPSLIAADDLVERGERIACDHT